MIVKLFKPQFSPLVESGLKLQTVRPTPKRMPKPGDRISLREWTGAYGSALGACAALQAIAAVMILLGPGRAQAMPKTRAALP